MRLGCVIVDDLQEASPTVYRLLRLIGAGRPVTAFANPDAVTQGFRGARPDLLRGLDDRLGTPQRPLTRRVLGTGHRMPPAIQLAWQRAAQRIPALETALGARRPRPVPPGGDPEAEELPQAVLLGSAAQEARWIGHAILERHLLQGVALQDIAVIVRSSDRLQSLQRHLTALGVPVTTSAAETPVRDESAVRPLLSALRLIVAERSAAQHDQELEREQPDPESLRSDAPEAPRASETGEGTAQSSAVLEAHEAVELLSSRIGGASAMDLRRLRQAVETGTLKGLPRGVAFRLIEAGGLIDRREVERDLAALSQVERRTSMPPAPTASTSLRRSNWPWSSSPGAGVGTSRPAADDPVPKPTNRSVRPCATSLGPAAATPEDIRSACSSRPRASGSGVHPWSRSQTRDRPSAGAGGTCRSTVARTAERSVSPGASTTVTVVASRSGPVRASATRGSISPPAGRVRRSTRWSGVRS